MAPRYRKKSRRMPEAEYEALTNMIYRQVPPTNAGTSASTSVFMADSDMMPTQTMADVRYIMTDNPYDCHLFIVDGVGDAILIEKERS